METKTNELIELRLEQTNFFTRWPCTFCGGSTEKVATLCEGETPDGQGLRACEFCLETGQEALDARMQKTAEEAEAHAVFLRSLVGRVKIPTFAAWQAAEKA